jgi:hypothetical protein
MTHNHTLGQRQKMQLTQGKLNQNKEHGRTYPEYPFEV